MTSNNVARAKIPLTPFPWAVQRFKTVPAELGAKGLMDRVKTAGAGVSQTFFNGTPKPIVNRAYVPNADEIDAQFNEFASLCVAYVMGSVQGKNYPLGSDGAVNKPDFSKAIKPQNAMNGLLTWLINRHDVAGAIFANTVLTEFNQTGQAFNRDTLREVVFSPAFIRMEEVVAALNDGFGIQAFLFIIRHLLGKEEVERLRKEWQQVDATGATKAFAVMDNIYPFWTDTLGRSDSDVLRSHIEGELKGSVFNTCMVERRTEKMSPYHGLPGMTTVYEEHYIWGEAAASWFNNQRNHFLRYIYQLGTPDVHWWGTYDYASAYSGGCFVAGTPVMKLDLPSLKIVLVPIESLKAGDLVVNNTGKPSLVSSQPVIIKNKQHAHGVSDAKGLEVKSSPKPKSRSQCVYGFLLEDIETGETRIIPPFVNSSHPFYSPVAGYVSLDPLASHKENDFMTPNKLIVGTQLLWADPERSTVSDKEIFLHYRTMIVKKITMAEHSGPIYGLHFREGARSYHAHGLLVAMNYPEITPERISKALHTSHHLSHSERIRLASAMKTAAPGLSRSLHLDSSFLAEAMSESHQPGTSNSAVHRHLTFTDHVRALHATTTAFKMVPAEAHPRLHSTTRRGLIQVNLFGSSPQDLPSEEEGRKRSHLIDQEAKIHHDNTNVPLIQPATLHLSQGHVVVDGQVSHKVHFSDDGHIAAHLDSEGRRVFLARIFPNGLQGIAVQGDVDPATNQVTNLKQFALACENDYNSTVTPVNGTASVPFYSLHTGLKEGRPFGAIYDPTNPEDEKALEGFSTITTENGRIKVMVNFRNDAWNWQFSDQVGPVMDGEVIISDDGKSFSGFIYRYDSEKSDGRGEKLLWGGVLHNAHHADALHKAIKSMVSKISESKALNPTSPLNRGGLPSGLHGLVPLITSPPPMAARVMSVLATGLPMSAADLSELPAPDSSSVHVLTMDYVNQLMRKVAWDQDQGATLSKLVGAGGGEPLVSGELQEILQDAAFGEKAKDFLWNKFFKGYALQSLVGMVDNTNGTDNGAVKAKDFDKVGGVEVVKKRLKWLWQGGGKQEDVTTDTKDSSNYVIASDPAFNFINNRCGRLAFINSMPQLSRYREDKATAEKWEKELWKHVNDPTYLNTLAVITATDEHRKLNKLCMIFYALNPNSSHPTDLCMNVMLMITNQLRSSYKSGELNEEEMTDIVGHVFSDMVNQVDAGATTESRNCFVLTLHVPFEQWKNDLPNKSQQLQQKLSAALTSADQKDLTVFVSRIIPSFTAKNRDTLVYFTVPQYQDQDGQALLDKLNKMLKDPNSQLRKEGVTKDAGAARLDVMVGFGQDVKDHLNAILKEAMTEAAVSSTSAFWDKINVMVINFVHFYQQSPNWSHAQRISAWARKFSAEHPIVAKFLKYTFTISVNAITTGLAIFSLFSLKSNWDRMRPVERAAAIMNGIAVLWPVVAKVGLHAWQKATEYFDRHAMANMEDVFEGEELQPIFRKQTDYGTFSTSGDKYANMKRPSLAAAGEVAADSASSARFTRLFGLVEKSARFLGIVAMGLSIVSLGYQIKDDFDTRQPAYVKTLDIMTIIVEGFSMLLEGVALAGELGMLSLSAFTSSFLIPVAGAILAIIGIIIMIIMLAIGRKEERPDSDVDKWIKGDGADMLNKVATPTDEWLNKSEKVSERTGG